MKTTICKFAMLLLAMLVAMPSEINAAKEKKEKKPYEWNWDKKLSGNKGVDDYLLAVDSIWYKMKDLNMAMDRYEYKEDTIMVNGKIYVAGHMEDSEGNYVTRGTVNWQFAQTTTLSADIVLEATQIALQTATATMSLPSLGMGALTYGKYVKAGPKVLGMATTGIKDIWHVAVAQAKRWNKMKKESVNPTAVWENLTDKQKELCNKCIYIREVNDPEEFKTMEKDLRANKSQEQLDAEAAKFAADLMTANVLPDKVGETLEDLNEDGLDKFTSSILFHNIVTENNVNLVYLCLLRV